jgi:WD40 repeat protein
VAVATFTNGVSLFSLGPDRKHSVLHGKHATLITSFSDDGHFLVSADDFFTTRVFDVSAPDDEDLDNPVREVAHQSWINAVTLSHDEKLFAIADDAGTVRVHWTQIAGEDTFKTIQYQHPAKTLAFSSNNQLLAMGSDDGTAHIYQREPTGPAQVWNELRIRPLTVGGEVLALDFNRASTLLAFGGSTGLLKICTIKGGSLCKKLSYSERIIALEFTSDGTALAVALGNGLVHLVQTETGDDIGIIQNHERGIRAIRIDETDNSLWTVSIGDSDDLVSRFVAVRNFPLDAHGLIQQSCQILNSFPEERAWAKEALGEPYHDVCQ